ncbi:helix-turn-helix domain-containing protein [Streptomyces sp. NBC_01443]|uniref:helix-turn-helix domain-containing protein n=1 Tax=Streptomyces sp. NBC_01443 TaxID=2903868 RepID=UPI002259623A|nr:helix-turn-helix domain-containing protein [Streptomyces sp. NBC_01443]MCX4632324.1 helix-turn-helix domain-containing protein [Streptomyces sp. NBC_01443]
MPEQRNRAPSSRDGEERIRLRLSQPELATMVGAAETTVHKALRELRDERLLETGYRSTVLPDLGRLTELAEPAAQ